MAQYTNLVVEQGASFARKLKVTNKDGTAFDLTNWSGAGDIKKTYSSLNTSASFTVAINSPTTGEINISLSTAQTTALKAGRYVYDVVIYPGINSPFDGVKRVMQGQVNVTPRVTAVI